MQVLIIEDEAPASKQLQKLILRLKPNANILGSIESVSEAVQWLNGNPQPDLLFLDIQLADGLSFDIFSQVRLTAPVIFTTAYDQYTLKAFKLNSVDYLLKPIDPSELEQAFDKFENVYNPKPNYSTDFIQQLLKDISKPTFKERFIVKIGQQLTYIKVSDINYFYSEDGLVFAITNAEKKFNIDYTLDQITNLLSPEHFFRINRKLITHISSIRKIGTYFNSRLKLELKPKTDFEVIVSRDRVGDFKKWLDR